MHVIMPAREWRAITSPLKLANSRVDVQLVRIDASDGKIVATTNRSSAMIRALAYGDVIEPGSVCIPIVGLISILKYCPSSASVTLRLDGDKVALTTDNVQHVFPSHSVDAISPLSEIFSRRHSAFVYSGEFVRGVNAVSYAAATELQRPALAGIYLDTLSPNPTLTAADGFRLARQRIALADRDKNAGPLLIPKDIIVPALDMARESIDVVEMWQETGRVYVSIGRYLIQAELPTSKYPDIERVLPTTPPVARVRLNSRILATSLKRLIKADPKETYCHVDISASETKMTTPGGTSVSLLSMAEGAAQVAINPRYFHAAVYGIDEEATVSIYEEANRYMSVEGEGYYALISLMTKR